MAHALRAIVELIHEWSVVYRAVRHRPRISVGSVSSEWLMEHDSAFRKRGQQQ